MKAPSMGEDPDLTWVEMLALARRVIHGFEQVERRPWPIEASMIELTKQTGDLARSIMKQEQYYPADWEGDPRYRTDRDVIANELADILYCVIRIADHYHIDLAEAHLQATEAALQYLQDRSV